VFAIRFVVHFGYKCVVLMYFRMRFNGNEFFFFSCFVMLVYIDVHCYTACCHSSSQALTLVAKHVYPLGVFKLISLA
jgi:hypothetical protein